MKLRNILKLKEFSQNYPLIYCLNCSLDYKFN